jgi:Ni,Fe-hydrogenase I small subunit
VNKPFTSTYDVLRQHGVDRRDFLRFCVTAAGAMGLEGSAVPLVIVCHGDQVTNSGAVASRAGVHV